MDSTTTMVSEEWTQILWLGNYHIGFVNLAYTFHDLELVQESVENIVHDHPEMSRIDANAQMWDAKLQSILFTTLAPPKRLWSYKITHQIPDLGLYLNKFTQ